MSELDDLEFVLLERLATGPWAPAAQAESDGSDAVSLALERLERLGLARMAGSNAEGPWMLTDLGRDRLDTRKRPGRPHDN